MQSTKEIEMLIARYKTDIAALEGREEDLMRQSDILENLIPNVLVSYMGKAIQTSQDKPLPENEIETEVRSKLEHLKGVLKELQLVVGLVKEEKNIMKKRIEELTVFLDDQVERIKDTDTPVKTKTRAQTNLVTGTSRAPERTKAGKVNENKPNDLKTEEIDNQQVKSKESLPSGSTDWKKRYDELQQQVTNITENLNSSSKKLKETEGNIKNLGEGYSKLKKELKVSMATLEKKSDLLVSTLTKNKEQDITAKKNSQDRVGKSPESEKLDTVSGVKSMKETLTKIPKHKVELHVHLDGAVRPTTAWELAQKKKIKIPGMDSFIQFETACLESKPTNLSGFLTKFALFWPPFEGDLDAIERAAYEFCEDESYAGVVYAEVRYSPRLALGDKAIQQLGPDALDEVIVRISQGLQRGEQDFGVKTKQILCAQYSEKFNDLAESLRLCQKHFDKGVVGIDLLTLQPPEGVIDEAPYVEPIISVYREAKQTGVHRTIHAAEMGTPLAVERAVYKLGSERVGHGYHVLDDQSIYQKCIKDKVHFECCPYSSLMTGSVHAWADEHPIFRFAKDGANFSINSDDPTVTGHTVKRDYELLSCWGIDPAVLAQSNINGCNSSFLSDSEKNELLEKLNHSQTSSNSSPEFNISKESYEGCTII